MAESSEAAAARRTVCGRLPIQNRTPSSLRACRSSLWSLSVESSRAEAPRLHESSNLIVCMAMPFGIGDLANT